MLWLALLGLFSLGLILVGWNLVVRRMRQYRQETETREARAFAEMMKIADERQNVEKQNIERRM